MEGAGLAAGPTEAGADSADRPAVVVALVDLQEAVDWLRANSLEVVLTTAVELDANGFCSKGFNKPQRLLVRNLHLGKPFCTL